MWMARSGESSAYRSNFRRCAGAKLQHCVPIPARYKLVFGWIFGPCVGTMQVVDPVTQVATTRDGPVKIKEFGDILSYQNEGLQRVANKVIQDIFVDTGKLCQVVLEKGNGPSNTRETVHIIVNADLPVELAEHVAFLVEKELIDCAEKLMNKKKQNNRRQK